MRRIGERRVDVSFSDGHGVLATGSRVDLSSRRVAALLVGIALACVATLALATLSAPTAPSTAPAGALDRAHGRQLVGMSPGLAAGASVTIGAADHSFWPVRSGASFRTRGGGIQTAFSASGARLDVARGTLAVSLASVARGRRTERPPIVAPSSAGNQIVYRRGSVTEFYRNGPYGLEQGFRLTRRPGAGAGSLVLALRVAGSLTPERVGSQILFRTHAGAAALRYGQLSAVDATGRRLPARMELRDGMLQLRINDSGARYPLRIDPFFQQGSKLTGGEESGNGQFGFNVALSSDGNTALIGGPSDQSEVGAAWVFTRSGSTWEQQGPKLTGGVEESGNARFGYAVALSANGDTALIGGGGDHVNVGAAWVFTRSEEGKWTQQGSKLVAKEKEGEGEIGTGHFGFRVALSADGKTALIGGPLDNGKVGAAWVFTRAEPTWEQQAKLTANKEVEEGKEEKEGEIGKGEFGVGVALSADGNTAMIGASADNAEVGAAWAFTRSEEGKWTQQAKLTAREKEGKEGEIGTGRFGFRVALSEDGNTTLIGAGGDKTNVGAAWVFTRAGSTWAQQAKLTGAGEIGSAHFGFSDALSSDGNTALIGGYADNGGIGAAWAFTRSESKWEQQGAKLTGGGESGPGLFGFGVALSGDATTALVGGPADNAELGAAWAFVEVPPQPPTVVTGSASSLTKSSATLNATVNPNGGTVTDCHFEYGTSTAYETNVPCTSLPGSGASPAAVAASIAGLSHTVYHFRIVATNIAGTGEGADQKFEPEEAPEYGRCVKGTPKEGGLKTSSCIGIDTEDNDGAYEWLPGAVKTGFTTALKEGVVKFETVKKVKTTCTTENSSGEYTGTQQVGNVVVKFTGCESAGQKCTTTGLAEGELETKTLEGKIGWEIKERKKVALDLFPVGRTGPFMEYTCTGGIPLTVDGAILVPVVVDKMALTSVVKYKQASGKQTPNHFEGGPKEVLTSTPDGVTFEQLGEAAALTQTNEEAIEINAVL